MILRLAIVFFFLVSNAFAAPAWDTEYPHESLVGWSVHDADGTVEQVTYQGDEQFHIVPDNAKYVDFYRDVGTYGDEITVQFEHYYASLGNSVGSDSYFILYMYCGDSAPQDKLIQFKIYTDKISLYNGAAYVDHPCTTRLELKYEWRLKIAQGAATCKVLRRSYNGTVWSWWEEVHEFTAIGGGSGSNGETYCRAYRTGTETDIYQNYFYILNDLAPDSEHGHFELYEENTFSAKCDLPTAATVFSPTTYNIIPFPFQDVMGFDDWLIKIALNVAGNVEWTHANKDDLEFLTPADIPADGGDYITATDRGDLSVLDGFSKPSHLNMMVSGDADCQMVRPSQVDNDDGAALYQTGGTIPDGDVMATVFSSPYGHSYQAYNDGANIDCRHDDYGFQIDMGGGIWDDNITIMASAGADAVCKVIGGVYSSTGQGFLISWDDTPYEITYYKFDAGTPYTATPTEREVVATSHDALNDFRGVENADGEILIIYTKSNDLKGIVYNHPNDTIGSEFSIASNVYSRFSSTASEYSKDFRIWYVRDGIVLCYKDYDMSETTLGSEVVVDDNLTDDALSYPHDAQGSWTFTANAEQVTFDSAETFHLSPAAEANAYFYYDDAILDGSSYIEMEVKHYYEDLGADGSGNSTRVQVYTGTYAFLMYIYTDKITIIDEASGTDTYTVTTNVDTWYTWKFTIIDGAVKVERKTTGSYSTLVSSNNILAYSGEAGRYYLRCNKGAVGSSEVYEDYANFTIGLSENYITAPPEVYGNTYPVMAHVGDDLKVWLSYGSDLAQISDATGGIYLGQGAKPNLSVFHPQSTALETVNNLTPLLWNSASKQSIINIYDHNNTRLMYDTPKAMSQEYGDSHDMQTACVQPTTGFLYTLEGGGDYAETVPMKVLKSEYSMFDPRFHLRIDRYIDISPANETGQGYKQLMVDNYDIPHVLRSAVDFDHKLMNYRNGSWYEEEIQDSAASYCYFSSLQLGDESSGQKTLWLTSFTMNWPDAFYYHWHSILSVINADPQSDGTYDLYDCLGNAKSTPVDDEDCAVFYDKTWADRSDAAAWQANNAYSEGERVFAGARMFVCTSAGTSHAADEPTWPQLLYDTVVDNGATWKCNGYYFASDYIVPYAQMVHSDDTIYLSLEVCDTTPGENVSSCTGSDERRLLTINCTTGAMSLVGTAIPSDEHILEGNKDRLIMLDITTDDDSDYIILPYTSEDEGVTWTPRGRSDIGKGSYSKTSGTMSIFRHTDTAQNIIWTEQLGKWYSLDVMYKATPLFSDKDRRFLWYLAD